MNDKDKERMRYDIAKIAFEKLLDADLKKENPPSSNYIATESVKIARIFVDEFERGLKTNKDGWIDHTPGNPNPVDDDREVEVKFDSGDIEKGNASDFNWSCSSAIGFGMNNNSRNIIAWRYYERTT